MGNKKVIVIISAPRTGTSHLSELLKNVASLRVYTEIFHPDAAWGLFNNPEELQRLSEYAGTQFESISDKRLTSWLRSQPDSFVNFGTSNLPSQQGAIVFKVFPGHLSVSEFQMKILTREDVVVFFVQRRPVDAFISDMKAIKVATNRDFDTTKVGVSLSLKHFYEWWDTRQTWYESNYKFLEERGIAYCDLTYENDIAGEENIIIGDLVVKINQFGFQIVAPPFVVNRGLHKQDLEGDYFRKVENWEEFLIDVDRDGNRLKLYQYFCPDRIRRSV